jgi:hypothetical protein
MESWEQIGQAQDDFSTGLGPIFFEVVLRGGK